MAKTLLDIFKKEIVAALEGRSSNIFTFNEISSVLKKQKGLGQVAANLSAHGFIDFLIQKTKLKELKFEFPTITISRYTWGEVPILSVVLTLKPGAYFSHYTAMYIHDLTEQMPKSIYLNFEQQKKRSQDPSLTQESIKRAFSGAPRTSNTVAYLNEYSVYMLNGKFTGNLGVREYLDSQNNKLYVTDIERTLIDIVVRPNYSGGVFEVLKAYERAAGKVSINKLAAMLSELNYVYPYHQAIGFYLEKTGAYKVPQINLLDQFEKKYDFYLTHQMKETQYSRRWKLYYPKNF